MTCFHPIKAYKSTSEKTAAGKCKIFFTPSGSRTATPIRVPCGQCHGCRLEKSRQWAARCLHESTLHEESCFITLTYNDQHLPSDLSLDKHHFQSFMKDFRNEFRTRKINPDTGRLKTYYSKRLRYYHSGEYGEASPDNNYIARPHYHALIFGHNFSDLVLHSSREGINLYTSGLLDDIWGKGFTTVGDVTFESAAYVARYIMKKVTGEKADYHYLRSDPTTGQIYEIQPEYSTMSRASGIGAKWYEKYKTDCYPSDSLSIRGSLQKPPKYYDYLHDLYAPDDMATIKQSRKKAMRKHLKDNTPERLAVREIVSIAATTQLKRTL